MRDILTKILPVCAPPPPRPPVDDPDTDLPPEPESPNDPDVLALLQDISARVVRIETRLSRLMLYQGVSLGNHPR